MGADLSLAAASVISISTLLSVGTSPLMLWVTDQALRLVG